MLDLLRKLRHLLRPREQRQAVLLAGVMLVGACLEMLGVGAIPTFISLLSNPDAVSASRAGAWALDVLGHPAPDVLVLYGAGVLLGLFLLKNVYLSALAYAQARYVFNRQTGLAQRLVSAYLYSPYLFHLHRNTADLLRNANQEAMEVVGAGLLPLLILLMEALTLTALLGLLLAVQPVISLGAFLVLGGVSGLFVRLARQGLLRYGHQMHEARAEMIRAVNEGLGGIKVTKTLGREAHFLNAFERAAARYAESGRARQVMLEIPRLVLEVTAIAGLLGVAAYLLRRGQQAHAILPTLTLLAVATVRMIPSFNRITNALTTVRYGRAAIGAVYDDLCRLESPVSSTPPPMPFEREIRLDGVYFRYPGVDHDTLSGITLEIPKGSVVGFVGTTGAGKTTLVDVILGLLVPSAGRVLVDGRDAHADVRAWQQRIGYVPQDVYLIDSTIRRNVALGLADEDIDEAALQRAVLGAQLDPFISRLPEGLDTVVGERGVRLSGGQRQRIGIARALYHAPDVLVLDEATSALDHETERAVMEAVEHLRGRCTILLIAHRMTTVENCDQIVRLRDGTVEENRLRASSIVPLLK